MDLAAKHLVAFLEDMDAMISRAADGDLAAIWSVARQTHARQGRAEA